MIGRRHIIVAARLVLAAAVLVWVAKALSFYVVELAAPFGASDEIDSVSAFDDLLAPVRPYVRDLPRVGFVSDRNDVGVLFRTQYALAPTLVVPLEPVRGLRPPESAPSVEEVIGVFEDPRSIQVVSGRLGLTRVRQLRPGVILFRKVP